MLEGGREQAGEAGGEEEVGVFWCLKKVLRGLVRVRGGAGDSCWRKGEARGAEYRVGCQRAKCQRRWGGRRSSREIEVGEERVGGHNATPGGSGQGGAYRLADWLVDSPRERRVRGTEGIVRLERPSTALARQAQGRVSISGRIERALLPNTRCPPHHPTPLLNPPHIPSQLL